jgi:hypothetical protein
MALEKSQVELSVVRFEESGNWAEYSLSPLGRGLG